MSGPRPRMGTEMLLHYREHRPMELCPHCDPSPGWGWEYTEEEKAYHAKLKKGLTIPRAQNGYDVQGPCRYCGGCGLGPAAL